jgi:hypothetical protein
MVPARRGAAGHPSAAPRRWAWKRRPTELKAALALALHLLGRLRTGWYASGLWSQRGPGRAGPAEVAWWKTNCSYRLRAIERAAQLRAGELPPADAQRLDLFCSGLRTVTGH